MTHNKLRPNALAQAIGAPRTEAVASSITWRAAYCCILMLSAAFQNRVRRQLFGESGPGSIILKVQTLGRSGQVLTHQKRCLMSKQGPTNQYTLTGFI